jgi:hypothetical protein
LTAKIDPLARVRALIDALDVDQPNHFDTLGRSFDTPEGRVSTPKPAELLGSRHFRHPAGAEYRWIYTNTIT